jgi:hypothetical protein
MESQPAKKDEVFFFIPLLGGGDKGLKNKVLADCCSFFKLRIDAHIDNSVNNCLFSCCVS